MANKDAERTLLRIKQKLQSYEHGEALSVEGQVEQLISEARDPTRLAKMFPGYDFMRLVCSGDRTDSR